MLLVWLQMVTYGQLHDKAAALARILTQVPPYPQRGMQAKRAPYHVLETKSDSMHMPSSPLAV